MGWKRDKRRERHRRYMSRHHIRNRVDGGPTTPDNLIVLRRDRHDQWHKLFHNLTFREAAALLLRAAEMVEKR